MIRTRFAPSPTGDLHLGGAWTALASWVLARRAGGATVLRVEDLDDARAVPGAEESIAEDLAWLGLTWDEAPGPAAPRSALGHGHVVPRTDHTGLYRQSERQALYAQSLSRLTKAGLTYTCDCSRAEIARVASAPHEGEETVYPGLCRDRDPKRTVRRAPAVRLRVPEGVVDWVDGIRGPLHDDVLHATGDFVLRRGDGTFAYQLAVTVDDVDMGITDVVRGADLLGSTARQILLARLLGAGPIPGGGYAAPTPPNGGAPLPPVPPRVPRYWHVPLVVGTDGQRLAKRTPGARVRALRDAGVSAAEIIGELAHGLGLTDTPSPRTAAEVAALSQAREPTWRTDPWPIPARWVAT